MITCDHYNRIRFQFLGIPPKGERVLFLSLQGRYYGCFQFLGIPPKGEQNDLREHGGTTPTVQFPISRDPPEGGTSTGVFCSCGTSRARFQFLGIPPKGELVEGNRMGGALLVSNF